jgi:hypothetical protein
MVVDVVAGAEIVVVAAVAGQLGVLVDQEMADVQVLVRREPVAALEEEIGGVLVPGAPGANIAGAGAEVREAEALQVAPGDRGVPPAIPGDAGNPEKRGVLLRCFRKLGP